MKDARFTLEFVSHCLANGGSPEDNIPDTFQRDSKDHIILHQPGWHAAFLRAISLARMDPGIMATDIQVDPAIVAPTDRLKRRYDTDRVRTHEAIVPGTKVVFNAMVEDHVTLPQLTAILERMGKYVGLSPFGFKIGFGKFNVSEVTFL